MATITDFVIELQGDRPFGTDDILQLGLILTNYPPPDPANRRELKHIARGASNSGPSGQQLDPDFTKKIVATVVAARGQGPLGTVCISGYSKGAAYALRLAQELIAAQVEIAYVGLADLPIFPYGNIPAISGFPPMVPENEPDMDMTSFDLPPRTNNAPEITPPAVKARQMMNYYQNQGNGMKPTGNKPNAGGALIPFISRKGWWWASNMPNDEIHGELHGWTNVRLTVARGSNDADYHSNGDADGQKRIAMDVSFRLVAGF